MGFLPWWLLFGIFFSLTLALEAPIYFFALTARSSKERSVLWFTANAVSYPPVFFLFPYLPLPKVACELTAEIWAPLCEIAVARYLLGPLSAREKFTIVGANIVSWLLGKALIAPVLDHAYGQVTAI